MTGNDASPGVVSTIVLKKAFPTQEEIRYIDEPVTVVRYQSHPSPRQFLQDVGLAKHAIMLVGAGSGITIMVHLYKGANTDPDARHFHNKLSRIITGRESISWDTESFWPAYSDEALQRELNDPNRN